MVFVSSPRRIATGIFHIKAEKNRIGMELPKEKVFPNGKLNRVQKIPP